MTRGDAGALTARVTHPVLLGVGEVEQFRIDLLEIIEENRPSHLLVNFIVVNRTSTAVINSLLVAKKKLLVSGGDIFLCGLQDAVRHNLRILNLEGTVFEVFDSEAAALDELASRRDFK